MIDLSVKERSERASEKEDDFENNFDETVFLRSVPHLIFTDSNFIYFCNFNFFVFFFSNILTDCVTSSSMNRPFFPLSFFDFPQSESSCSKLVHRTCGQSHVTSRILDTPRSKISHFIPILLFLFSNIFVLKKQRCH